MRNVVVDCCALITFRFRQTTFRNVAPLIAAMLAGNVTAYAPAHLILELLRTTRKEANLRGIKDKSGFVKRHMDWFRRLPIHYYQVDYLTHQRELRLLVNRGVGSYDAVYAWLTGVLGAELCTTDNPLARSLPGRIAYQNLNFGPFR